MSELMLALEQIEKEKGISKEIIIDAIEKSLLDACKKDFGKSENVTVNMDRETGAIEVYAAKTDYLINNDLTSNSSKNKKAKELGMTNTHFENACGLEAEGHVMSARDIAVLSRHLLLKHPEVTEYSTIWMDTIIHKTKKGES